jgi:group I intron endonuclease
MSRHTRQPTYFEGFEHGLAQCGGVYVIENTVSGAIYIGSTHNLRKRWQLHRCRLRAGNHHSPHLQRAWDKYGAEAFRFITLIASNDEGTRLRLEQHFITTLTPAYNVSPTAVSTLGVKRSVETRARIQAAVTQPGRLAKFIQMAECPKSAEHRARSAAAHVGMRPSEETREKLRAASAKRWAEHRRKKQLEG